MLLAQLRPDMVLAEDVFNFQGMLLLKANTMLTVKNINMLKSWGIVDVAIAGGRSPETSPDESGSPDELRTAVEEDLRTRFADSLDNPVMEEILTVAADIWLRKRSRNE